MIGTKYTSNNCGDFIVVEYINAKKVVIEFIGYKERIITTKHQILIGQVKNPMTTTLYGTGFIGIGAHKTKYSGRHTSCYRAWNHMIERCYSEGFHSYSRYGGRGIIVCDEWHNFQNFATWYEENHIEGYEIDKDIIGGDLNKYSPESCVFIPGDINKMLTGRYACRGLLPIGVYQRGGKGSFLAACNNGYGKAIHIGSFKTPEAAFAAYKAQKKLIIETSAQKHFKEGNISLRVYDALMNIDIVPYPD